MTLLGQLPGINLLYNQYSENREKRKEYYLRQCEIKSYAHFLKRVNGNENTDVNSFNAPVRIKPFGLDFGVCKQDVVDELGKPDYVLVETGIDNHQVIFYKKRISGHSCIIQVHFLMNKMVYAMNRIRDISAKKDDFFMNVTRMLLSKYSLRPHEDLSIIDSLIHDEFDNKVAVTETIGLSIRYVSGSKDFIGFLNDKAEDKKSKMENVEIANLDRLLMII